MLIYFLYFQLTPTKFFIFLTMAATSATEEPSKPQQLASKPKKPVPARPDSNVFNLIHFSDVYDICDDSKDDNRGGASRFLSALNIFKNDAHRHIS